MSVNIQVPIPDELIPCLEERAQNAGLKREQYLSELLSRELSSPVNLDEILATFRAEVKSSAISDSDLTDLFKLARLEASPGKV